MALGMKGMSPCSSVGAWRGRTGVGAGLLGTHVKPCQLGKKPAASLGWRPAHSHPFLRAANPVHGPPGESSPSAWPGGIPASETLPLHISPALLSLSAGPASSAFSLNSGETVALWKYKAASKF